MSINSSHQIKASSRGKILQELSELFSKIKYLELPQKDFPTDDLHQLSLLVRYSIHPAFSSKRTFQFYKKLASKYWNQYQDFRNRKSSHIDSVISEIIEEVSLKKSQSEQTNFIREQTKVFIQSEQIMQFKEESQPEFLQKITEAIQQEIHIDVKVSKNYFQITKYILEFDEQRKLESSSINAKMNILNAWTAIPSRSQDFKQKLQRETPQKVTSSTYLQSIKMGKNSRKDSSNNLETSRTIILGRNESTETKQMKHILKVQAKTNFVEEKRKQEEKMNNLDKKSVQLTYLLNVITKQFFDDFFGDILRIIKQNPEIVSIFCNKIIEKVKEQHNFIQIYVELVKKLCKCNISQPETGSRKANPIQDFFVATLQNDFIELIQQKVEASCSNFNEYRYQKQMMGMSKFVGKLIKAKVLSKKIFKVCFWQIVYRYVEKVKENAQSDIVNQCLIEAVVTISQEMGSFELSKLMKKQDQSKIGQIEQQDKLARMMAALVNPNDQDHITREQQYNKLIQSINVEDYPYMLISLVKNIGSKRMKLQFLIEGWSKKMEQLKNNFNNSQILQIQDDHQVQSHLQKPIDEKQNEEDDFLHIRPLVEEFIKQLNADNDLSEGKAHGKQLKKHQKIIKNKIQDDSIENSERILQKLTSQFLNEFCDTDCKHCKHHGVIKNRTKYFTSFINSLDSSTNLESYSKKLYNFVVSEKQLENLMIIECDYPFLIEGVSFILLYLAKELNLTKDEIVQTIKQKFSQDDEDMTEFCQKIEIQLSKVNFEQIEEN